ncbi:MAG: TetR/AcrR family transcriptional regulator [Actinobacteria bacterium]|nr:MAG: TetR/AcrR family transcriptional regulator [Actinomycetota bacterium]
MASKRLTREESRAQTRARLIDAAAEVFLRQGFDGASLEGIAEEAGYTRGAVYSNFDDKDELFLEVVQRHFMREVESVERIFGEIDSPEGRIAALQEWHAAHCEAEDALTSLIMEFYLYASRNPELQTRVRDIERRVRDVIERLVEQQMRDLGVAAPIPARDLATIVAALDMGLGGQRFVDREGVGTHLFGSALMLLTLGVKAAADAAAASRPMVRKKPHAPARRRRS